MSHIFLQRVRRSDETRSMRSYHFEEYTDPRLSEKEEVFWNHSEIPGFQMDTLPGKYRRKETEHPK